MAEVVLADPEAAGLPAMVAALLVASAEQPAKASVLAAMRGTVTLVVPDAEVEVGLRFGGGRCTVQAGQLAGAAVRITMPAEELMGMSTMPLLFGLPSLFAPEGRELTRKLVRRQVRIEGLRHLRLVRQLTTVLAVD